MKGELGNTGNQHPPGQRHGRLTHEWRQQQRRTNQREVEQYRRESRHGEAVPGIEHTAGKGGERDQQQVRKGEPQHVGRQRQLGRITPEAGRKEPHQPRRSEHRQGGYQCQYGKETPGHRIKQLAYFAFAATSGVLGKHRNKGLVESPFGKQPAHEVGNLESDEKGIRSAAGTEQGSHHHIAHQPHDP